MNFSRFVFPMMSLTLATSASAATLVQYTMEVAPNDTPVVASTVGAGVTATGLATTTPATSTTSNPPSGTRARAITMNNFDDSFATDHYYEFTLTPTAPGTALDLTALTFLFNLSASNVADQASTYQLRYDDLADGAGFQVVGTSPTATTTSVVSANFDLSAVAFANLTSGITFRLDYADSGSTASNASLRLDDLTVTGDVIPEPGTALTLLGGATVLLGWRRARRGAALQR